VGRVINIANGERVTINEVFEKVKKLTGRMEVQPEYYPSRTGDVRDSLADLTLARSILGYNPTTGLEEGLSLTLDWWKSSRFSKTGS
jgi:nucleoside-diphosphate-sugar epimerase